MSVKASGAVIIFLIGIRFHVSTVSCEGVDLLEIRWPASFLSVVGEVESQAIRIRNSNPFALDGCLMYWNRGYAERLYESSLI